MTDLDKERGAKNCPFCGADRVRLEKTKAGKIYVLCQDCGSTGPAQFDEGLAIRCWNMRHGPIDAIQYAAIKFRALESDADKNGDEDACLYQSVAAQLEAFLPDMHTDDREERGE